MNNFEINPNFNTNFDSSIKDFNKIFSDSLNQTNKTLNASLSFDDVFNKVGENFKNKTVKGGIEVAFDDTKKKNLSPVAKLASDIGKGFSNSLTELNDMQKKGEQDIETFASGGDISIHEVMISAQKSGLAMNMAIQLRNQMMNAYNEFKNMTI